MGPKAELYDQIYQDSRTQALPKDIFDFRLRVATTCFDYNVANNSPLQGKDLRDAALRMADEYIRLYRNFLKSIEIVPEEVEDDFIPYVVHDRKGCKHLWYTMHWFKTVTEYAENAEIRRLEHY